MVMEGDLTWGGKHTIQYTDDVLQNCTPETYIILLIDVNPDIQVFKKKGYIRCCKNETHMEN